MAVIATIATLAALLLPVLSKAKIRAQQTSCMSNLRQLGLAWIMYYGDNSGYLAESYPDNNPQVWVKGDMRNPAEASSVELLEAGKLYPYHRNPAVYKCPTDKGVEANNTRLPSVRSYSMNSFMGARPPNAGLIPGGATRFVPFFSRDSDLRRPSELWVLIDEDERSIGDGFFVTDPNARIWFDFPAISSYRHNFGYAINFGDGHSEVWRLHDSRSRLVNGNETEQLGNSDLDQLARVTTVLK
jgi:hypothetical protein